MYCLRWVCRWNAPVPPSVFHLANGQPRKKSPMPPMQSSESRSEPGTRANMPLLRQLEFAFKSTDSLISIRSLRKRRTRKSINEDHAVPPTSDADLQIQARHLLRSLGADRIATELRVN